MNKLYIILTLVFIPLYSHAIDKRDIPRFMSLKVSEANIRTGPGVRFPIKWILVKKHVPLEVLDHFENWYKVRDEESQEGWIHKNLMSRERFFVVSSNEALLYKNPKRLYVLYGLEFGVRGKLQSCRNKWCEVKIDKMTGWLKREDIWGVYSHEVIK